MACPLHNWVIDLESGRATGADEGCATEYPVRLDGDEIRLFLAETRAAAE